MSAEAQLRHGLIAQGLDLSESGETRLLQYLALLAKWNRAYNLTAIREPTRLVSHHVLDSLSVLPHLVGRVLVDVGTGAGLPGIPLAIAKPNWSVTLIDSNHKKTAFLRQAVIELKLQNVDVITDRVERVRLQRPADVVISRAFTDLAGFAEAARHLTAQSGILAAMKGVHPHEELDQLPIGIRARVIPLEVPGLRAARHLVLLQTADAT